MDLSDLYGLLGVARGAPAKVIRRAFLKLSRRCHPEVNPGDSECRTRYLDLRAAWEVLGDPSRRQEYDRLGHDEYIRRHAPRPAGPVAEAAFLTEAVREGFIGELLGVSRPPPPGGKRRGDDLRHVLRLPFMEAITGGVADIRVQRRHTCPDCDGRGTPGGEPLSDCQRCRGAGNVVRREGLVPIRETCPACGGRGKVARIPCPSCSGSGVVERRDRVKVKVPPGVTTGTELRLRGMGDAGVWGGPPGDLMVVTRVDEHPRFVRRGDAIHGEVELKVWQVALGAEVSVATVDGEARLKIPPGTQPGQEFVLPGRGVPNLKTGRRGDHVVRVTVHIPAAKGAEERRAWERLAAAGAGELSAGSGL